MAKHAVIKITHETDNTTTVGHVVLATRNPYYSRRGTYGAPDVFDRAFSKARKVYGPYTRCSAGLIGYWETSRTEKRFIADPHMYRNVTTIKA